MEESRDLLVIATSRILSNLARLQPSLDLEAMTALVDIIDKARKAAEAYAKKFDQVEVDEDEGDDEEGSLEEEVEVAVDGAGSLGGATA